MVDYKKSKHVNVLDFGADPTGTSDSATAIQNAIKSVAAVPGGVLSRFLGNLSCE